MAEKPKKNLESAAAVLQGLLENVHSPLSDQFRRWRLWTKWESVVGERLAKNTEPVHFDRGTLFIFTPSAAWVQQLQFFKDEIITRVNKSLGANWVKRLHFTTDRRGVPASGRDREFLSNQLKDLSPKK